MNSSLDKKAYNDARYGGGCLLNDRGEGEKPRFRGAGVFKLRVPVVVAIVLSIMYGGQSAATEHLEYAEVAHQAFKASFFQITNVWQQITFFAGLPDSPFLTSVVEFCAVVLSLFFALSAGIGGAFVAVVRLFF
jgi:hypothetical protein